MNYWYMFPCGVNEKSVGDAIIEIFRQIHNDPETVLTLYISSTGGDIDSAIRFYDFIKSTGIIINTVGFGQVDSAAVLLFLCGKERTLIENCRLRLHAPTYNGAQQSQVLSVHSETTSLLQQLDNRYFEIVSKELPLIKDVRALYDKGKIFDLKTALKHGLATKIEKKLPMIR